MKLCHIVPSLQEQHGGPSKSVRALCIALARAGHDVELLAAAPGAPRLGSEEMLGSLRIRVFRRDWPHRFVRSSGMRAALAKCDADIIHHHALWLRTLHYAHGYATRHRIPLVISPRGMMSTWAWNHHRVRKTAARTLVHPGALQSAAGWHATSFEEATDIRTLQYTQPCCIAPNGVDAPDPGALVSAGKFWTDLCPEVATRPVALFYGRFHEKKRLIELIDVWLERCPKEWLLLLVGLPEDYTPEMLERYAHQQSGAGRVRAFSGASRPAPYAIARLFLLCSHNENFGLAVAEAMAHGVPVVVTDTTPWHQVNTEQCGWCVPWSDYGAALSAATATPLHEIKGRGDRARDWIVREYSWDRAAGLLTEFYVELLAQKSVARTYCP